MRPQQHTLRGAESTWDACMHERISTCTGVCTSTNMHICTCGYPPVPSWGSAGWLFSGGGGGGGTGGGRAARCCNDPAVQHAGMEYVSQQPACWPVGLQAEDLEYNYDIKGLADLRGRLIAAIAAYNGEGGGRRRRKHAAHHSCD